MNGPVTIGEESAVHIELLTGLGRIEIELDLSAAPLSAGNFLRHVDSRRFDGAAFYRTVRREHCKPGRVMDIIQGGLSMKPGKEDALPVPHESPRQTGLRHVRGAVSLARAAPGTASTEFFICLGDCPGLDPTDNPSPPSDGLGYAVFGHVVAGLDVVAAIHQQATQEEAPHELLRGQILATPVLIEQARRLRID